MDKEPVMVSGQHPHQVSLGEQSQVATRRSTVRVPDPQPEPKTLISSRMAEEPPQAYMPSPPVQQVSSSATHTRLKGTAEVPISSLDDVGQSEPLFPWRQRMQAVQEHTARVRQSLSVLHNFSRGPRT